LTLDASAFTASAELISSLHPHAERIHCSEERVLFRQGDAPVGLYIALSGPVTLVMNSLGHRQIASLEALPGSLIGLPALISDQPYGLTATAGAGAQLAYLPREAFVALMRADPPLALQVLKIFDAQLRTARQVLLADTAARFGVDPN
jgi:CRP-like cAMP-binding protein